MADLMNTFQAAEYLDVSPFVVRKLVRQGLLTSVVITRDHLFRVEELDRYKAAKDGLNVDEVAAVLGVARSSVYRWMDTAELASRKVGWSRVVDRAEVERFAAERGLVLREAEAETDDEARRLA